MKRCFYTTKPIFLGLFTAQILSTIQVYLSNTGLFRKLMSIRDAGYLAVPNRAITDGLQEFGPAFFGGLFFTLTVGAGLSVLSFGAAWIWDRILRRNKFLLIPFLLLWVAALAGVNRFGFSPMVSSYYLVVPPLVFIGTCRWMPGEYEKGVWIHRAAHFFCIVLLALLWASQLGSHMFLNIRDSLLVSNAVGRKINDFYYKYTLYPAEVFKSLEQKTLKTCSLPSIRQGPMGRSLEKSLYNHDYLCISRDEAVDLRIVQDDNVLVFENRGSPILRVALHDFLSSPVHVLRQFSSKSDRHGFFRQFTFLSLLTGFPLTLYVIFHALFCAVLRARFDFRASSVTASGLCLFMGITLLVPVHFSRSQQIGAKELAGALESGCWQERVAALKMIEQERLELGNFTAYQRVLASPHVAERYWLARALGVSRKSETYKDLLTFLDDPCPSVVSMAFYALGQRGDKRAIQEIVKRIEVSDHWYNQWYAYKALRNLGWRQKGSTKRL